MKVDKDKNYSIEDIENIIFSIIEDLDAFAEADEILKNVWQKTLTHDTVGEWARLHRESCTHIIEKVLNDLK